MRLKRKRKFRKKLRIGPILLLSISFCFCFMLWIVNSTNTGSESNISPAILDDNDSINVIASDTEFPVQSYKVTRVIDGDTIEIEEIGKVRLIGIDSPELDNPKECFAEESAQKLTDLVTNESLRIEYDSSQGDKDRYGRALLYLFNEDGININLEMISLGYSYEYTYNEPYKYQSDFLREQSEAKLNKVGLWAEDTCNGSSEIFEIEEISPVMIVPPIKNPTPTNNYTCDCSKTCPNMSCQEAQYQLNICGCTARDGDKDGYACDSQCQ